MREAFEVGTLQFTAPVLVDHQAARDAAQVRARLLHRLLLARIEQAHEGFLGQVGGMLTATGAPTQPAAQPRMMGMVQLADGGMVQWVIARHGHPGAAVLIDNVSHSRRWSWR